MEYVHGWDWVLLGLACYIAVVALVRLMLRRRDRIITDVRQRLESERGRKKRPAATKRDQAA